MSERRRMTWTMRGAGRLGLLSALLVGCGAAPAPKAGELIGQETPLEAAGQAEEGSPGTAPLSPGAAAAPRRDPRPALEDRLAAVEARASPAGRAVLEMGRKMTLEEQAIVEGSCWDFAHAVYNRAGFPLTRARRETVFQAKPRSGKVADLDLIEPGDFVSYVNYEGNGGPHSAIFVEWLDRAEGLGLMLSYAGGRSRSPARYRAYTLRSVFRVVRPRE